jgi:hypothetical protein
MLDLCSSCARHVRRAEPRCPFCGSALAHTAVIAPRSRLARTAIFALGAGVAACGPPNCPKDDSPSPAAMQTITLADGGTELQPMPIAIYGTAPPCR